MNKPICGFRGQYKFLSNFFPAPVMYNGIRFLSSEAAFQAQKCPARAAEFATLSPAEAKRHGRHVSLRSDWEKVKVDIMREIVLAKFTQNPELGNALCDTGTSPLFEENYWGDRVWGTVSGQGENLLGRILQDVRIQLQKKQL